MNKKYDVIGNHCLFNKFILLSRRFRYLNYIIQNDTKVTEDELTEWTDESLELKSDISNLLSETWNHITNQKNRKD